MSYIFSIDAGNIQSAYCILDKNLKPIKFGKVTNEELLEIIQNEVHLVRKADGTYGANIDHFALEMVASYGLTVGKEVFDTCLWVGRFYQAIVEQGNVQPTLIYRKDEKMALCGFMRAKDSNIRHALIERFAKFDFKNGKGTKKNPDWFYGFRVDIWAAYAVAIAYNDIYLEKRL